MLQMRQAIRGRGIFLTESLLRRASLRSKDAKSCKEYEALMASGVFEMAEKKGVTCLTQFADVSLLVHEHFLGKLCCLDTLKALRPPLPQLGYVAVSLLNLCPALRQDLQLTSDQ